MAQQNTPPVMHCGLLKTAGLLVCTALLVFFVSAPGTHAAAAAPASSGSFSIHISSYQQEINAIKHVRQLTAKGWPSFSRKVVLPRKGTWWRVYVGPYATQAEAEKQASRLKAKAVSQYSAIERTRPETAKFPAPPPAAKPPAPPPTERAVPAPKPTAPSKGKIFFPDMTSTEPIRPVQATEAVRKPPAARPAVPAATSKPAGSSPAGTRLDDVNRPEPGSKALPRLTDPPARTSQPAPPPALSVPDTPAAVEERPLRNEPAGKGSITWGDLQEDPVGDESGPTPPAPPERPVSPAPASEPAHRNPDTTSAQMVEPQTTAPVLPGDRVEARKYYEKANEYVAKGMLEIAVTNYSRSIELDPTFAEAYNGRGLTYEAIQRSELAISDYDAALRLKPDYSEAIYNRALACRKSGRFDQARRNLQSACALKHRRACEMLAEMKGTRK